MPDTANRAGLIAPLLRPPQLRWVGFSAAAAVVFAGLGLGQVLPPYVGLGVAAFVVAIAVVWELLVIRRYARAAAEAHLITSERLRRTIDDAPIGMATVALDGRWLQVNSALSDIVGYDQETLLRMTFQDITHPDDLAIDLEQLRRTIRGEIPGYVMQKRYRHRDGHEVPVELHVSLVHDADGAPAHFISQIVDLTLRMATERALRRQEAAFAALVEESEDVVIRHDANNRIVYANPATVRGSGIDAPNLIGKRVDEVGINFEFAERWNASLDRVITTGKSESFEYTFPHPDGGPREWQVRFTAEQGTNGQMSGAFAVSRDITDLQRATESLRRRKQEFAALVENAEEMIARYDLSGRYRYANPAALTEIGRSLGEILGRSPAELLTLPPATVAAWEQRNALAIRERRTVKIILENNSGSDHRWYESSATPEFDAMGRPTSLLVVSRDITASRKASEEIERREQEWVALMEGADDVIARYDLDFRTRYINRAITRVTGVLPSHFIGRTNAEAGMPLDLVKLWEGAMQQVLTTDHAATVDFDFPGPEGTTRHFHSQVSVVRSSNGTPYSLLVISRDITPRRVLEIERERLLDELTRSQAALKTLKGLLPTCAWCRRIRDENGEWEQMERYISRRTEAEFSHGLCPDCAVTMLASE